MEQRKIGFLDCPGEIRNIIYHYVLVAPLHVAMHPDPAPDISESLFLCRSLLRNNTARKIHDPDRLIRQIRGIGFSSPKNVAVLDLVDRQRYQYIHPSSWAALLATCRTIRDEASTIYHQQNTFFFPHVSSFIAYCSSNIQINPRPWWCNDLTRLSLNLDSHSRLYDIFNILEDCSALSFLRLALPYTHYCAEYSCYGKKFGNFLIGCFIRLKALRIFEVWRYESISGDLQQRLQKGMVGYASQSLTNEQFDLYWESQVCKILSRHTIIPNKAHQPPGNTEAKLSECALDIR